MPIDTKAADTIRLLSSSASASHGYANRVARDAARYQATVLPLIEAAVLPTWKEILQRGKLLRNGLHPAANSIIDRINECHTLVDGRSSVTRVSPLSVNESCGAQIIVAMGDPNAKDRDRRIDFLACNLNVTRKNITLRLDVVDFSVTPHVLARFIQRGRGDAANFFAGLMPSMHAARLLAVAASKHPSGRLLLPHQKGFLLAHVEMSDDPDDDERKMPCVIRYDIRGKHVEPAEAVNRGHRIFANAWSFVDADSTTGPKAELHAETQAWMTRHQTGIRAWFDMMTFGSAGTTRAVNRDVINQALREAMAAAKEMGESPVWERFAKAPDAG